MLLEGSFSPWLQNDLPCLQYCMEKWAFPTVIRRIYHLGRFSVWEFELSRSRGRSREIVGQTWHAKDWKAAQHALFWIGYRKRRYFLTDEGVDQVIDTNRVSHRMIVIKVIIQSTTPWVISVYAPKKWFR